jgi:hypothetical protein
MNWYAQRYAPKIYLTNSNYIEDHAEIITTARFHKKVEAAICIMKITIIVVSYMGLNLKILIKAYYFVDKRALCFEAARRLKYLLLFFANALISLSSSVILIL